MQSYDGNRALPHIVDFKTVKILGRRWHFWFSIWMVPHSLWLKKGVKLKLGAERTQ